MLGEGLGHERGVDALRQGNFLDDHPKGHQIVGSRERIGVTKINLLLSRSPLMMGVLHRDSHLLQHGDRAATEVSAQALRGVVKVAGLVDRRWRLAWLDRILEEKELHLGVGIEGESKISGLLQRSLEHIARIGVGR
jgi:hypothetical protein